MGKSTMMASSTSPPKPKLDKGLSMHRQHAEHDPSPNTDDAEADAAGAAGAAGASSWSVSAGAAGATGATGAAGAAGAAGASSWSVSASAALLSSYFWSPGPGQARLPFTAADVQVEESALRESWRHIDQHGTGMLASEDFKRLLSLGGGLSKDEVAAALAAIDINGTGMVTVDEFCLWNNQPDSGGIHRGPATTAGPEDGDDPAKLIFRPLLNLASPDPHSGLGSTDDDFDNPTLRSCLAALPDGLVNDAPFSNGERLSFMGAPPPSRLYDELLSKGGGGKNGSGGGNGAGCRPSSSVRLNSAFLPCAHTGCHTFHSNCSGTVQGYCGEECARQALAAHTAYTLRATSWPALLNEVAADPDFALQHAEALNPALGPFSMKGGCQAVLDERRALIEAHHERAWRQVPEAGSLCIGPQIAKIVDTSGGESEGNDLLLQPGASGTQFVSDSLPSLLSLYGSAVQTIGPVFKTVSRLRGLYCSITWSIKPLPRLLSKARTKYGGCVARVLDVARLRVQFRTLREIKVAVRLVVALFKTKGAPAYRLKDHISPRAERSQKTTGTDKAARSDAARAQSHHCQRRIILLNVMEPETGHVCEIVFELKSMADSECARGKLGFPWLRLLADVSFPSASEKALAGDEFVETESGGTYAGETTLVALAPLPGPRRGGPAASWTETRRGKPHGLGKEWCDNLDVYEGSFVDGVRDGPGRLQMSSGALYVGGFVAGKRCGSGSCSFPDGRKYIGTYAEDFEHGKGVTTFADGDQYRGEYENAEMHGKGTYFYADSGDTFIGDYLQGEMHGNGSMYFKDGVVESGRYELGKPKGHHWGKKPDGTTYSRDFDGAGHVHQVVEVCENQRAWPLLGFNTALLPTDKGTWTDADYSNTVQSTADYVVPEGFAWVVDSEWKSVGQSEGLDVDENGWQYAILFQNMSWSNTAGAHSVRRRIWRRAMTSAVCEG